MLVNYISVCIFFPSVVVTYHYFWQDCKSACGSSTQDHNDSQEEQSQTQNRIKFIKPIGELFTCVVNWFEGPYVDYVILHPIIRWVVMIIFLSVSVVFMSFAVQLRPDEEQVSHFIQIITNIK